MLILEAYYGRLGNKMYQLMNILNEAIKKKQPVNLNNINYLTPITGIINIEYIENIFKKLYKDDGKNIKSNFFPKDLHLANKRTVDISKFFLIAKTYIIPSLKLKPIPFHKRICCIHIRGGDIFRQSPHSGYVQPPLNYYIKIINDFNDKFDEFYLITKPMIEKNFNENYNSRFIGAINNPCIEKLLKYSNKVKLIKGNLYEHYFVMLQTTSIVLSRSSFSDTTVFINPNLENIIFWNWNHCLSDKTIIPKNINVYSYKLTKPYINEWKCTNEQLKLMIEYDINNIELE